MFKLQYTWVVAVFAVSMMKVLNWTALLAILAFDVAGSADDVTSTCTEPKDLQMMEAVMNTFYKQHWSFYNSPTSREEALKITETYTGDTYRYSGPVDGDRTRKQARARLKKHGGNLCPAIYKLQHDGNRVPPTIRQAFCLCERCLLTRKKDRKKFRCEKIIAYTTVFRRNGCKDGEWIYRQVLEPIAVACSCNLKVPP